MFSFLVGNFHVRFVLFTCQNKVLSTASITNTIWYLDIKLSSSFLIQNGDNTAQENKFNILHYGSESDHHFLLSDICYL